MPFALVIILASIAIIFWQIITMKISVKWQLLIAFLISSGIIYLPIGITFQFGPYLPYSVIVFLGLLTTFSIFFLCLGVFRFGLVVLALVLSLLCKRAKPILHSLAFSSKVSIATIFITMILSVLAFYEAAKVPEVKHYKIAYENLPKELEGYKIAHISDTHSGIVFRADWHKAIADKIKAENVNLVAHTGDIADGYPNEVADSLAPFLKLSAPDGVYYSMGNHENYHSIQAWRDYYKNNNLTVLEDEYKAISGLPLVIAGASAGPNSTQINYHKILSDIEKDNFVIILDHYPNRAHKAKDYADLQLSGHTHGGTTFFFAPIVKKLNEGFVKGLYTVGNMQLFVTSGAGLWSYAPFRLLVPSEIAVIELEKKK